MPEDVVKLAISLGFELGRQMRSWSGEAYENGTFLILELIRPVAETPGRIS